MIIVSGTIEVGEESREAAINAIKMVMEKTALEAGCIVYRFYQDIENAGLFRVYEEWESLAHLEDHFKMPHLADFREALSGLTILGRDIKMYEVGDEGRSL